MLRRLALATLLLAANVEAEVVTHRFWIATDTAGTRHQAAFFYVCDTQVELPAAATEGDQAWAVDTNKFFVWDGAAWLEIGAGGGGAPATAQYWVGAADATLSAEHNLGTLSTGLVINTAGTPSAYAGTSCTNQFPRSLSDVGAATCASVASADFGANILGLANGGTGLDTSATADDHVLVSAPWSTIALANGALAYNTTTDVFAQATFADVSGTVALGQITDDVSSGLCLLSGGGGDPAWTTCPGGGGGLSYAQVAAAALAGF